MKTYCVQNDGDCDTCSLVNYGRDCENIPIRLYAERKELAETERNLYSPEFFPGSAAWKKHDIAFTALNTFDLSYPEIRDEMRAQRKAKNRKVAEEAGWI